MRASFGQAGERARRQPKAVSTKPAKRAKSDLHTSHFLLSESQSPRRNLRNLRRVLLHRA